MFDSFFILSLFSTGYNPRANVSGQVEFPKTARKEEKPCDAKGAFRAWDARGALSVNCSDNQGFIEWIERKAMHDLNISMWKDAWKKSIQEDGTRALGMLELCELMEKFPVPWMEKVGLFDAANTTPAEVFRFYKPEMDGLFGEGI